MSRGRTKILISTYASGGRPRSFGSPHVVDITPGIADLDGFSLVGSEYAPDAQLTFYDPYLPAEMSAGQRGDLAFFWEGFRGKREIWPYEVSEVEPVTNLADTEAPKHVVHLKITDTPVFP